MLDVDGGHDVDAGVEQLQHVFVALAVLAAGNVGVGQLVDDDGMGMAGEDGVHVHLFQVDAAIGNHALGNDFEIADAGLGLLAPVRLDQADDDIDALLVLMQVGVVEHVVGFAHAGRGADVDAQLGGFRCFSSMISAMLSPPPRDDGFQRLRPRAS